MLEVATLDAMLNRKRFMEYTIFKALSSFEEVYPVEVEAIEITRAAMGGIQGVITAIKVVEDNVRVQTVA